jgi:hypothetical protein
VESARSSCIEKVTSNPLHARYIDYVAVYECVNLGLQSLPGVSAYSLAVLAVHRGWADVSDSRHQATQPLHESRNIDWAGTDRLLGSV